MKIKIPKLSNLSKIKVSKLLFIFNFFKFNPRRVSILFKHELKTMFFNPVNYGVAVIFLIVTFILFLESYGYAKVPTDDLTNMFSSMALAFVIVIPALTMNAISKERQTGTLEYILTQPISEFEFVLAKFLSITSMVKILVLATIPTVLSVGRYASLDLGQLITQYIGIIVLGMAFAAIGVFISSLFKSEVLAFISTFVFIAIFMTLGSQFLQVIPLQIQQIFALFSPLVRYQSIGRGVIEIADVLYFFGLIVMFLIFARYFVATLKFPQTHKAYIQLRSLVIISILLFVTLATAAPALNFRIDATSRGKYTLSEQSKLVLEKLQQPISVKLFATNNLPFEYQPILTRAINLLKDYQSANSSKFILEFVNFGVDDEAKIQEASTYNIYGQNIIVSGDASQSSVIALVGIGFEYDGLKSGFALSSDVTSLEFQITRNIMQLAKIERPVIGIAENMVGLNYKKGFTQIPSIISDFYEFVDFNLTSDPVIFEGLAAVIVLSPSSEMTAEVAQNVKNYVLNGGSVFMMYDTLTAAQALPEPVTNDLPVNKLFEDLGIKLNNDFIKDANSNLVGSSDQPPFFKRYPEYPIVLSTQKANEIFNGQTNINTFLPSSISIDDSKPGVSILYTTSEYAVSSTDLAAIGKNIFSQNQNFETRDIIASFENEKGGRLIVGSDSYFLSDEFVNSLGGINSSLSQQNALFVVSAIEWLSKPNINISEILGKTQKVSVLALDGQTKDLMISLSVFGSASTIAIIASFAYSIRRKLLQKTYNSEQA
jgi:ABC-type transport system involved in multi-copper enzyme maturation permease subunit